MEHILSRVNPKDLSNVRDLSVIDPRYEEEPRNQLSILTEIITNINILREFKYRGHTMLLDLSCFRNHIQSLRHFMFLNKMDENGKRDGIPLPVIEELSMSTVLEELSFDLDISTQDVSIIFLFPPPSPK